MSDIRTGTINYWVGPNAILSVRTKGKGPMIFANAVKVKGPPSAFLNGDHTRTIPVKFASIWLWFQRWFCCLVFYQMRPKLHNCCNISQKKISNLCQTSLDMMYQYLKTQISCLSISKCKSIGFLREFFFILTVAILGRAWSCRIPFWKGKPKNQASQFGVWVILV